MMKQITVFTPTFNRKHLLTRLFESLQKQSIKEFKWLIIDDGSSDQTDKVVEGFKKAADFEICYHYQNNKGMVGAHQTAHNLMDTNLCVCIDSDDYLPENAIERILDLWNKYGYDDCAGLIGLDAYEDGNIIGNKFPEDGLKMKFTEMHFKYKVYGDKKFVHNRRVFNQYLPYQFFEGEKFPVTSYIYHFIEQKHRWIVFNEVFCIVEYQEDGLSANIINQYKQSPKSWAHYRLTRMKLPYNYYDRFKNSIHYVSSSIMAKNRKFYKESPYKLTTLLAIPLGFVLNRYIIFSNRSALNKNLNKKK